jgi:hypothetical protein
MNRIHILLDDEHKARYRRQAEREGKSLGAWLREAAEEKLAASEKAARLDTVEELRAFFKACDSREGTREPEWEAHLRVMAASRSRGLDPS